jgi:hypothetical protein
MRGLSAALAALVLAGCALIPPRPASVDEVVGEALRAARAPASGQKAALARAQQSVMRDPSTQNRLRLATMLASLPAPLRNDARAAELLQPIADPDSPGAGRFAALLLSQITERQRIAREKEKADKEHERLDQERERADKERDKREETLRQQLDALRSIERGILEREERLRRRR